MPFSLLQALEEKKHDRGPWDAIIIDEVQGFYHKWWPILQTGLRDAGEPSLVRSRH